MQRRHQVVALGMEAWASPGAVWLCIEEFRNEAHRIQSSLRFPASTGIPRINSPWLKGYCYKYKVSPIGLNTSTSFTCRRIVVFHCDFTGLDLFATLFVTYLSLTWAHNMCWLGPNGLQWLVSADEMEFHGSLCEGQKDTGGQIPYRGALAFKNPGEWELSDVLHDLKKTEGPTT